jgi:hypothetical protein
MEVSIMEVKFRLPVVPHIPPWDFHFLREEAWLVSSNPPAFQHYFKGTLVRKVTKAV